MSELGEVLNKYFSSKCFNLPWGGICRNSSIIIKSTIIIKKHVPCLSLSTVLPGRFIYLSAFVLLCFVFAAGQFGIPEGIVFSMPVKFENGTWVVLTDLEDIEISEKIMTRMTSDLIQVMSE